MTRVKLHFGEFYNLTFQAISWPHRFCQSPMLLSKSHATLKVPCYSQSPMLLSKSHATLKAPCYSQSPMLLSKSHATLKVPCYYEQILILKSTGRIRAPNHSLGISKAFEREVKIAFDKHFEVTLGAILAPKGAAGAAKVASEAPNAPKGTARGDLGLRRHASGVPKTCRKSPE